MKETEKIEIMHFDQEGYLEDGRNVYEAGKKMTALADRVHEEGYDAVFLMGVGGTWDEFMQLEYLMNKFGDRDLEVYLIHAAEWNVMGHKRMTDRSVVLTASESGTTPEVLEAVGKMREMGVRVFAIPDGDVAASILTCMPDSEVDVLYGIGGAPEGVVSAAVIRALDGDMNGRLLARHDVKGDNEENRRIGEQELARCKAMGIEAGKVLRLGDMARSDNVIFSATGITKGDLLEGISRKGNIATTETLLIRGKSRTIRRIQSIHYLDRKDPDVQAHIL